MKLFIIYAFCFVFAFSFSISNALLLNRFKALTKIWSFNPNQGKIMMPILKIAPSKISTLPKTTPPGLDPLPTLTKQKIGSPTVLELNEMSYKEVLLNSNGLKAVLFTDKSDYSKAMLSNFVKASLPTYQLTNTKFFNVDIERYFFPPNFLDSMF